MKNILTSILCIALSFCATYFTLNNFHKSSTKPLTETNDNIDVIEDESDESNSIVKNDSSSLDFSNITSDYEKWSEYDKENIALSSDFIPVDVKGEEITKKEFLERLKTGNYIPVKLFEANNMYQLYSLEKDTDEKIVKSIKNKSSTIYNYFLKEGTDFPEFDFTDLNGNNYTSANTKAQYLVIECWFVQCTQCIQEFPKLNILYDKYESYEDILFFSLAFDKPEKIKKILAKKEFRYPVVANQKAFIKDKIKPTQYPVHIIVDKYGTIIKVLNNVDSLKTTLDNLMTGDLINEEMM